MSGSVEVIANGSGCETPPRSPDDRPADEDYIEELTRNGPVELRAYGHQVGGHSLLMKFGKAVCKPMIPRERFFYDNRTRELRHFTPIYYGVASIKFHQDEDGRVHLLAIPRSTQNGIGHSNTMTTSNTEEKKTGEQGGGGGGLVGGMETLVTGNGTQKMGEVERLSLSQPIVRLDFFKASTGCDQVTHEGEILTSPSGKFFNPWSVACMENVQSTLSTFGPSKLEDMFQDYLVLEDLTCKFECPCVLDLKMGTRQYGDDQSEEKKLKHIERCALSTSSRLGVRINGMQVYNAAKKSYIFKDKYYGRELSPDGFHDALKDFLHNGLSLRTDLLPSLISQLRKLEETISKQDTFRFYSSSLLIMYDGKLTIKSDNEICSNEQLIDNISTISSNNQPGSETREGEEDTRTTERSEEERERNRETSMSGANHQNHQHHQKSPKQKQNGHHNHLHHHQPSPHEALFKEARRLVDIRMIDFAHTTHSNCTTDPIKYSGPDVGYLLGLKTLITSWTSLLEEAQE